MACFSLTFWEQVCIMIVIIIALWSLLQLLLPYVTQFVPALVVAIIRIIVWAVIAIICIYIIFGLIGCLISAGGGLVPSFQRHSGLFGTFYATAAAGMSVYRPRHWRLS
jgi:hypothetical protein